MEIGQLHPLILAFKSRQLEAQYWAHILPKEITDLLIVESGTIAQRHEQASILFSESAAPAPRQRPGHGVHGSGYAKIH